MQPHPPEPARSNVFTALISGGLIVLIIANIYLYVPVSYTHLTLPTTERV